MVLVNTHDRFVEHARTENATDVELLQNSVERVADHHQVGDARPETVHLHIQDIQRPTQKQHTTPAPEH